MTLLKRLIPFLICIPSFAAISVDNVGPVVYRMRSGNAIPVARTTAPDKGRQLTVTSTLSGWTMTVTGGLSNACVFFTQCFGLSDQFTGTAITSGGVGATTVNINWYTASTMEYIAPGTYTGNIVFHETTGGAEVSTAVSVYVMDTSQLPTTGEAKVMSRGPETGCTLQPNVQSLYYASNPQWTYLNICPIPNEAPAVALPTVVQPALGASYTDSQFGGVVTRVSSPGQYFEYGGISPFSAYDGYVVHSGGVTKLSNPGAIFRAISPYLIQNIYPSATDDNSFYATNGTVIDRFNYVTPQTYHLGDLSAAPYYFHGVYEGGTQNTTEDNWQAFYDDGIISSSTSMAIGTGSKTFTMNDGFGYEVGASIILTESSFTASMSGTVTASSGASVTVNVTTITGSGTFTSWRVGRLSPKICAINLPLLEAQGSLASTNTFCAIWTGVGHPQIAGKIQLVDWVQVTEVDDVSHERYVYLSSSNTTKSVAPNAGSTVFTVGAAGTGVLNQKYIMPEQPGLVVNNYDGICQPGELCMASWFFTHNTLCKDSDGQVWMYGRVADSLVGVYQAAMMRLSAGADIMRPEEAGGGLRVLESQNYDIQPGCSSRVHAWSWSNNQDNGNALPFAGRISSASAAGSTVTITFTANYNPSWSGSRPLLIQGATGSWAPLNGLYASSTYSGGTTIQVVCAGCTGSSGAVGTQAMIGDANPSASTAGDRGQFGIMRPGKSYTRIAMTRSWPWQDLASCWSVSYYGISTFGSISRSGKLAGFISNFGSLDCAGPSSYVVTTGLDSTILTGYSVTPSATTAMLSYNVADSSSCSTEISAGSGFSSILRTLTDAGGTTARNYNLGALTASTNYWIRTACGQQVEAAAFTTRPALTSTRTTTVQLGAVTGLTGVNNVVLEYRLAGTTSYTAISAVPCAAGCKVTWPADVGLEEYRLNWRNVSNTVLRTTPNYSMMVNR